MLPLSQRLRNALRRRRSIAADPPEYAAWLAAHVPTAEELRRQSAQAAKLPWQPTIDLIVSRRPGDAAAWAATLESLRAQTYPRFHVGEGNGELVGFLDAGDTLAPHALFSVASCGTPDADLYYSDEDVIEDGRRVRPLFKPGWSPDSLLSRDFVGGLKLLRRHLVRPARDEHDLLLLSLPKLRSVRHLADVLFHRRPGFAPAPSQQSIADYVASAWGRDYRVSEKGIFFEPAKPPRVAVIIPIRDKVELLEACLESIEKKPSRAIPEIVVVDNGSVEPATQAYLAQLSGRATVLSYPQPFNWSAVNNFAAARCTAEYLLFLTNDVEVLTEGWLDAMLAFASRPDIGAVGAQLLYPDGTLQHYGVVMGMTGYAGHLLAGCERAGWTTVGPTDMIRDCTAVTGACMMMRRKLFEDLGGFDERFIICGSDVEICLRSLESGHRNLVTPHAQLTHFESKTRGTDIPVNDFRRSFAAYEPYLRKGDPYYNPQLSLKTPKAEIRLAPEDMLTFARGFI